MSEETSGKSRRIGVGVVIVCALVLATVGVAIWHPWGEANGQAEAENTSQAVETTEKVPDNMTIAGQEIDYYPGEYGDVIVDGPTSDDFSSAQAWQDYQNNWHDKSWKGELPASGRYQYAHFEGEDDFSWAAGEVLAVFTYDTPDERIRQVASDVGARVGTIDSCEQVQDYKTADFYFPDNDIDPLAVGQRVQEAAPDMYAALPDLVNKVAATTNDTRVNNQYYLDLSHFKDAWDVVKCQGTVEVAVFDSGIDFDHPDLRDNIDTVNAYDAIERQHLDREDVFGHGTKVSGIISGVANNRIGIAGCSYNARILPIRVLDDAGHGRTADIGEALGHLFDLDNKPEVVNMSFAFPADDWYDIIGEIEYGIICQGRINELSDDYGIVFVAAAGNDGETTNARSYPAALNHVIGVGSVNRNKNHSSFSNANNTVDICAQGESTLTTTSGSGYNYGSGTSFAAPQVSAAAVLLKAQNPNSSPEDVESQLKDTAEDLGNSGRDDQYGYGLLNTATAVGWSSGGGPGGGTSPNTGGSAWELLFSGMEDAA